MAGRSSDERTGATRERVEHAALQLFVTRGFTGTSLREIAQSVGISVPAIYYHFASKDELLRSVVEPLLAAADALLDDLSRRPRAGFARRALESYYDLIVGHFAIYRLVSTDPAVRGHPEVGPRVAAQSELLLDLLAGVGAGATTHGGATPTGARAGTSGGATADHDRRLRAAAATGALRRPLRMPDVDPRRDRALIVSAALGALGTELVHAGELSHPSTDEENR